MKTKAKFWYNKYKYHSDKLNALISKSKKNHLRKYFEENYNDSKKTWQKINELLHHKINELLHHKINELLHHINK